MDPENHWSVEETVLSGSHSQGPWLVFGGRNPWNVADPRDDNPTLGRSCKPSGPESNPPISRWFLEMTVEKVARRRSLLIPLFSRRDWVRMGTV